MYEGRRGTEDGWASNAAPEAIGRKSTTWLPHLYDHLTRAHLDRLFTVHMLILR